MILLLCDITFGVGLTSGRSLKVSFQPFTSSPLVSPKARFWGHCSFAIYTTLLNLLALFFIPLLSRSHPSVRVISLKWTSVSDLNCLSDISAWMQDSHLRISLAKSELLVFPTSDHPACYTLVPHGLLQCPCTNVCGEVACLVSSQHHGRSSSVGF